MIRKIFLSEIDKRMMSQVQMDDSLSENGSFDYSRVVVRKPWGHEYLIYQNEFVAVWILFIKKSFKTSMHCHPKKKTSLIVLSGKAICSTLNTKNELSSGEGMLLDKGVFHSTTAISDGGSFVMEIETPVNKRDLIRLKDEYGREGKGYETVKDMSFNTQNYNYISLIEPETRYNVKRKFGKCSILLKKFKDYADFENNFKLEGWDAVGILKGQLLDKNEDAIISVGDTISHEDIKMYNNLHIKNELETVIIKKVDNIVKVSDYIISLLEKENIRDLFTVPGSANVHLLDSLGLNTNVKPIFMQTEQSATLAAESFAKLTGKIGAVIIASGSSSTNALTGVADAWVDSTPLIILSGQSNSDLLTDNTGLRQLGIQEIDITSIVKPITKYSVLINDSHSIKYHIQKAISLATSGRPGPTWISIPIDILGLSINEEELENFNINELTTNYDFNQKEKVAATIELLKSAKRPVILAGNGIRISKCEEDFMKLINMLNIPVLTSRRGADLLSENHPLFFGRPGAYGQRSANFIIQNADLLLSIGSRLSLPQTGRRYWSFAKYARKVIVDIDKKELGKKTVKADVSVNCDAKEFILEMIAQLKTAKLSDVQDWIEKCHNWRLKYPQSSEEGYSKDYVNAYNFIETLSDTLNEEEIITLDGGSCTVFVMQALKLKQHQRLISSTGLENTCFALPASIGASIGSPNKRIICICEEHGFQNNVTELETITRQMLPIKIFILNGKSELYIQKVQAAYFGNRFVGSPTSYQKNLSASVTKIGETYKIPSFKITKPEEMAEKINTSLLTDGPTICEIEIDQRQQITPRIIFSVKPDGKWVPKPLEDMYPLLNKEELKQNMLIGIDEDEI